MLCCCADRNRKDVSKVARALNRAYPVIHHVTVSFKRLSWIIGFFNNQIRAWKVTDDYPKTVIYFTDPASKLKQEHRGDPADTKSEIEAVDGGAPMKRLYVLPGRVGEFSQSSRILIILTDDVGKLLIVLHSD